MIEQAVARINTEAETRRKRIYRGAQIVLAIVLLAEWVLGFTLLSMLWEGDRPAFWIGLIQVLLLGTPVLALIGVIEILVGRLGVEYDYELSADRFRIFRIARSRRKLCCSFAVEDVIFYKRYSELHGEETQKLKHAQIFCCNSDSPALTVVELQDCLTGRKRRPQVLLLEMGEKLDLALRPALRRNGL